jgi:hypothetical protein
MLKLDRKLLLIAPTIVLVFVVAALVYAGIQIRGLTSGEDTWSTRRDFVASVAAGQKTMSAEQAVGLLNISLEVEGRRAAALHAAYDLLLTLAGITAACCVVLAFGIRRVPREHWPRLRFGTSAAPSAQSPALES